MENTDKIITEETNLVIPEHVALILDGNGRWAKKRGLPRTAGHKQGCVTVEQTVEDAARLGIKYLTVYGFSTENWKRSRAEVEGLLKLFRQYLKRCIKKAHKNQMRVKIIGDPSAFPQDIQDSIHELEECSKDYDHMYFQIAMNYGSRDEILRGMTRMIEDVKNGTLAENAFDENGKLTEQCFESYLDTAGIPDPDLLIRTSGEQRLSNYLMWQLAYTEFYFTEVPWPDFHEEELRKAIEQYNNRDRRYGGVKEE